MKRIQSPFLLCLLLGLAACGSSSTTAPGTVGGDDTGAPPGGDDTGVATTDTGGGGGTDTGKPPTDTGTPGTDTGTPGGGDAGTVRRLPCMSRSALDHGLPADQNGAIEGELVSLVPPGGGGCPSDSDHLHLQIDVSGKRYDVAIDVNSTKGGNPIALLTKDVAPGAALPLGWNAVGYNFVTSLGAHSGDFKPSSSPSALIASLTAELAPVSRVTIHGKSYTDGSGIHDIHKTGCCDKDGVILAHGIGAGGTDHAIALRFSTDSF